ncbi:hypothetical protein EJB05_37970, partial [Eragrostis curvula]
MIGRSQTATSAAVPFPNLLAVAAARRSRFRFTTNPLRSDAPARRPPRAFTAPAPTASKQARESAARDKTPGWPRTTPPRLLLLLLLFLLVHRHNYTHAPAPHCHDITTSVSPRHDAAAASPREDGLGGDVEHGGVVAAACGLLRAVAEPRRRREQDGGVVFHSSPAASPPRSLGRDSRDSSSSRFSASKAPSSRRGGVAGPGGVAGGPGGAAAAAGGRRGGSPWMKEAAIEEEGLLMDDDGDDGYGSGVGGGLPKRWRYGLGFVGAFFALFFFFALILWGASHNQRPVVTMHSVTFHKFVVQAGTDASLVPTEMSTLNATVKLTFRNTGSFFGVHVSSQPVTLNYYQLVLASGNLKYFYQARKSQRSLTVAVVGDKVPLYGGGSGLSSTPTTLPPPKKKMPSVVVPPPPVPLKLSVRLRSRAFVLGKLVKPKFISEVQCSVTMDQTKMGKAVKLDKACTYTH